MTDLATVAARFKDFADALDLDAAILILPTIDGTIAIQFAHAPLVTSALSSITDEIVQMPGLGGESVLYATLARSTRSHA